MECTHHRDHRECMGLLEQAGIYLILDGTNLSLPSIFIIYFLVNTPQDSIDRGNPADSYNAIYLQHVFATIDAFKSYNHVLGFFSGNEVINDVNTTGVQLSSPSTLSLECRHQHGSKQRLET